MKSHKAKILRVSILLLFVGLSLCISAQTDSVGFGKNDAILTQRSQFAIKPVGLIGLGYLENSELGGDFTVSFEYSRNRRLSFIATVGCFPWNRYVRQQGSFFSMVFSLEARSYFALRSRHPATGLFAGAVVGYNWSRWGYNTITNLRADISWKHVGVTFGYQLPIRERFRIGTRIVAAYPNAILVKAFDRQGHLVYRNQYATRFVGYAGLSIGYAF